MNNEILQSDYITKHILSLKVQLMDLISYPKIMCLINSQINFEPEIFKLTCFLQVMRYLTLWERNPLKMHDSHVIV